MKISPLGMIVLLSFFLSNASFAQNINKIKHSGRFYYGSGTSFVEKEARDMALEELTQQIAVNVKQSFVRKVKESGTGLQDEVKSILKTHSAATLKNVKIIKTPQPNGKISVFCYIDKNEVSKIFAARKRLVYDMFRKAEQNEQIANVANALKWYYFAQVLMNSVPDPTIVVDGVNLTIEIPERINHLIQSIRFRKIDDRFLNKDTREITFKVTTNGVPVSLLDFMFWDGQYQQQVRARDGLATLQLLGASVKFKQLDLTIKYSYYDARDEIKSVKLLWDVVQKAEYKSARTIALNSSMRSPTVMPVRSLSRSSRNFKLTYQRNIPVIKTIKQSTQQFLDLLQSGNLRKIKTVYGRDPFLRDKIVNYIKFNHPQPLDRTVNAHIDKTPLGYELRRIRVLQKYPSIHKQSTEYLVLDFDYDGRLIDLNTSISETLFNRFVKQAKFGHDWKERQQIIKFIEKYRTSYLVRDLRTINLMFADSALIIVGRKIKAKKLPENTITYHRLKKQPAYQYLKLTKKEYLRRLKHIFYAQEDIFLNYGTFNIIKKSNSRGLYGVQMRQSYYSTTYSDEGYLFLLIDFKGINPLIYIRAWQPNEWSDSAMVKAANFMVYK